MLCPYVMALYYAPYVMALIYLNNIKKYRKNNIKLSKFKIAVLNIDIYLLFLTIYSFIFY
jgi:hypothetical protein